MPYQDEKGHFTTRENDGGPCKHESPDDEPKAKKTIRGGKYLIGDREVTRDEWDAHDGPDEEMDATTDEDFEIDEKVAEKNTDGNAGDWDSDPDLEGTSYPNVKNYKGHSITSDNNGYSVYIEGDEVYFYTLDKAKAAIDGKSESEAKKPEPKKEETLGNEGNGLNNGESKKILDQMSGIRNEEKEKEADLLREWSENGSISYEEFKEKEKKLHQETQNRIDSLYEDLNKAKNVTPASSASTDAKGKVEAILGRKFGEEEWKRIVELAKSIK